MLLDWAAEEDIAAVRAASPGNDVHQQLCDYSSNTITICSETIRIIGSRECLQCQQLQAAQASALLSAQMQKASASTWWWVRTWHMGSRPCRPCSPAPRRCWRARPLLHFCWVRSADAGYNRSGWLPVQALAILFSEASKNTQPVLLAKASAQWQLLFVPTRTSSLNQQRACAGYVSRAKVIDRSLPVEASRAGLAMRELPGTRAPVGGGLEGVIFHLHWP